MFGKWIEGVWKTVTKVVRNPARLFKRPDKVVRDLAKNVNDLGRMIDVNSRWFYKGLRLDKFASRLNSHKIFRNSVGDWGLGKVGYHLGYMQGRFFQKMGLRPDHAYLFHTSLIALSYFIPPAALLRAVLLSYNYATTLADVLNNGVFTESIFKPYYMDDVYLYDLPDTFIIEPHDWELFAWFPASYQWDAVGAGGDLYNSTDQIEPWEMMNEQSYNPDLTGLYAMNYFSGPIPAFDEQLFPGTY